MAEIFASSPVDLVSLALRTDKSRSVARGCERLTELCRSCLAPRRRLRLSRSIGGHMLAKHSAEFHDYCVQGWEMREGDIQPTFFLMSAKSLHRIIESVDCATGNSQALPNDTDRSR